MASNHSSQRSRVKGTLEVYHAYISDTSSVDNDNGDATTDSGGWEMVQQPNNSPMEQVADVCPVVHTYNMDKLINFKNHIQNKLYF